MDPTLWGPPLIEHRARLAQRSVPSRNDGTRQYAAHRHSGGVLTRTLTHLHGPQWGEVLAEFLEFPLENHLQ